MRRAIRAALWAPAIAATTALVLAGCTAGPTQKSGEGDDVLGDDVTRSLVEALPEAPDTGVDLSRLEDGLVPPTNTWFSGLVFGDAPNPVFPLPLSFALARGGVEFGVPTVTSNPGAIAAPHAPQQVLQTGTDAAVVTRYDEVSVTVALRSGAEEVAEVTIARGSPVISYTATADHEVRLGAPVGPADDAGDGVFRVETETGALLLVAPDASVSDDGATVRLPAGASANWVAVPDGAEESAIAELAGSPLERVTVSHGGADDTVTTTLRYETADGSPTAIGRLPHHADAPQADAEGAGDPDCSLGEFSTVYGPMPLCPGPELTSAAPQLDPTAVVDLTRLDEDEQTEVLDALESDLGSTGELPADTYFGGKGLARLANMLQLARQLDGERATAMADGLASRLAQELRTWTDPAGCEARDARCFTYDTRLRGVVGREVAFGSDEFNDHHFHYGYFLYAAAVLAGSTGQDQASATVDDDLVAQLRPVMDLLAADLASSGGELFPTSRAFDPYSGHSWASGFAPFADGNNQESSSEAVSAYNGLALWAEATGDDALGEQAKWMLSTEAHSARAYWTNFDREAEPYAGYDRGSVGIVWDAKRDFATWFAPEPAAVLGIQVLPMHPVAEYLAGDDRRILENIAEVAPDGAEKAALFPDYLLMYQALAGREAAAEALEGARTLPEAAIDDGNSRAYLLAFILSRS